MRLRGSNLSQRLMTALKSAQQGNTQYANGIVSAGLRPLKNHKCSGRVRTAPLIQDLTGRAVDHI